MIWTYFPKRILWGSDLSTHQARARWFCLKLKVEVQYLTIKQSYRMIYSLDFYALAELVHDCLMFNASVPCCCYWAGSSKSQASTCCPFRDNNWQSANRWTTHSEFSCGVSINRLTVGPRYWWLTWIGLICFVHIHIGGVDRFLMLDAAAQRCGTFDFVFLLSQQANMTNVTVST